MLSGTASFGVLEHPHQEAEVILIQEERMCPNLPFLMHLHGPANKA
jgi:hypothetical protein